VVPMFLGTGRHAREDLPPLVEQLRAGHPGVVFVLQKPVGEDGRVLDLIARIALE
jgi:sirohydrochlorin cobaltochelatase